MTTDVERGKTFYGQLFGWKFEQVGEQGAWRIRSYDRTLGMIWPRTPGDTDPPCWMAYVSVPDVDAAAKVATENGGKVVHGPTEFPGVGRFAAVLDSDGAMFLPFKASEGDQELRAPKTLEFCWETLVTKDEARAKEFYAKVCGWQPMAFGPSTTVFSVDGTAHTQVADIQKAATLPPMWLSYVSVKNVETTRANVEKFGGKVNVPLIDVPTVGRISLVSDPLGAQFGLFQPTPR